MPGLTDSLGKQLDAIKPLQVKIDILEEKIRKLFGVIDELTQHPLEVKPDEPLDRKPHFVSEDTLMGKYLRTDGKEGAYFDDAQADEVVVDASAFTGNLSGTDTNVQKALDTIDGISIPAGDVVGPASAVDDRIATFDGITGKLIQDGGKVIADLEVAGAAATAVSGHESTYDHSKLHDPATVSGNGIALAGQQISLQIGTGATEIATGNHLHTGVYDPAGTAAGAVSSHEGTYAHGDIASNSAHRTTITGNPHAVTKTEVGLSNVTNDAQEILANKNAASGYAGLDASSKLTGSQQVYGSLANTACEGNDARLSDARTPTAHAASHASGGSDAIKLDDLAAPDDNADLNASTTAHGLLKKLSNVSTEFMNGQGSWATPAGSVQDKIEEGNSKVEVIDTGTGYVSIYIDGAEKFRLGTSGIYDTGGNLLISFGAAASAVNYLSVGNAATGNVVRLTATGSDSNVGLALNPKGSGAITLAAITASCAGTFEATGYIVGGNSGHSGTYSWLDGDGVTTRNLDISGGIITNAYNN